MILDLIKNAPALESFESFTAGGYLHVEAWWCHGLDPAARVAAVTAAGAVLGVDVRSMAGGSPRKVQHWATAVVDGVTVIVAATVCECHDGLAATLGHFEDAEQVIAAAVGAALRSLAPAEYHPLIAAAETVIDVELAFRPEVTG